MKLVCTKCHTVCAVPEQTVFGQELKRLCRHCGESLVVSGEREPEHRVGNAYDDNSGFINIRAVLESSTYAERPRGRPEEEEPVMVTTGSKAWTGDFPAYGSPALLKSLLDKRKPDKSLVLALSGAVAILSATAVAAALILKSGEQPQSVTVAAVVAPAIPPKLTTQPVAPKSGPIQEGTRQTTESVSKTDPAVGVAPDKPAKIDSPTIRYREIKNRKPRSPRADSPKNLRKRAVTPASKVAQSAPSKDKKSNDDLLDLIMQGQGKPTNVAKVKTPSAPAARSTLPEKPSREQVLRALRSVQPALKNCARGKKQVVTSDIVVANTGQIKSVRMSPVTGPAASCMAREVKKARFPQFSSPSFSVKFPFQL